MIIPMIFHAVCAITGATIVLSDSYNAVVNKFIAIMLSTGITPDFILIIGIASAWKAPPCKKRRR